MAVHAVGHRVVVKPDPIEEYSEGGIAIVSDKNRELAAQTFGTVVEIGPQAWMDYGDGTPWVKEGDRVIYAKYAGMTVREPDSDTEYVVLNDTDIIAKATGKVRDLERG